MRTTPRARWRSALRSRRWWAVLAGLAALTAQVWWRDALPAPIAPFAWLAAGGGAAAALWASRGITPRRRQLLGLAVGALALAELAAARQGLEVLTVYPAELAHALRPSSPAVLEVSREGRLLSLVDTAFPPGDERELRARLSPPMTPEQADTFLSTSKLKEAAAANTGMLFGAASLDGYDGGLLPLVRFGDLKQLLIESAARRAPPHPERRPPQPDGLLRLELPGVPDSGLLAAAGVRGVVMDRVYDAWADGAYYDLGIVRLVEPGATLKLDRLPDQQSTALGLVSYLEGAADAPQGTPAAEVLVYDGDGGRRSFMLRAGEETAEGRYAAVRPEHGPAQAAADWRSGGGQSYLARLPLGEARYVQRVELRNLLARGRVAAHGLSLLDERLGIGAPAVLDPALRRAYLGDLKVYENLAWLPGVWAVFSAVTDPPADAARTPGVLPTSALLETHPDGPAAELVRPLAEAAQAGEAPVPLRTLRPTPEHVIVEAALERPALAVFPEAYYPGWTAELDGRPVEILRANALFQAIYVPAGQHRLEFRFTATRLEMGGRITAAALAWSALTLAVWGVVRLRARRRQSQPDSA